MSEFGLPQSGFIHVPVDNGDVKVYVWDSKTFWSNKNKEKENTRDKEKENTRDKEKDKSLDN
jgi:hypothetical protein